jgi:hypothetical protein
MQPGAYNYKAGASPSKLSRLAKKLNSSETVGEGRLSLFYFNPQQPLLNWCLYRRQKYLPWTSVFHMNGLSHSSI